MHVIINHIESHIFPPLTTKLRKNFKRIHLFSLNLREMHNDVSMPAVHTSFHRKKRIEKKIAYLKAKASRNGTRELQRKITKRMKKRKERKKKISRKIHVIDNTHLIYYKIEFSGKKDEKNRRRKNK